MNIQTLWYFVCLVFGFHSLDTLVQESYEVIYEKSNGTKIVQYLFCKKLSDFHPNETIDLKLLRGDLCNHFNSSRDYRYYRKIHPIEFEELILNRIKSGDYLILNGQACLIVKDRDESNAVNYLLNFAAVSFEIRKDTFDLLEISRWGDKIDQLIVLNMEHPYSDCGKSNRRFFCLNECFKRRFRLARYFYSSSETGLMHLNYVNGNQTIKNHEKICFKECKRENCKVIQLISNSMLENSKFETFQALPKLLEFDYWLQLIGLVCSFAGLSFYELTSVAIEFALSKVRKRKVRIALVCLKLVILFIALACCGYLCTRTILDHKAKERNPTQKEMRNLIQPKTVHLAICVDVKKFLKRRSEDLTMSEIERATDGLLDEALNGIEVNYWKKSFQTNFHTRPKVLFFDYRRCFFLSIQPSYQVMPFNPKLVIKFNKVRRHYALYLLSENEDLNGQSFEYSVDFTFMKRVVERLRSSGGCVDYEEKYGNCTGRWNCVERCIAKKFMKRFNKMTFGIDPHYQVVDRDWFSPAEWNTFNLMKISKRNLNEYESMGVECLEEIPDVKPCIEIQIKETVKINPPLSGKAIEIDLQFDVVRSVEESPSWYKLALDLVSIQSIFFGLTLLGSLKMVCSFAQARLKVRENQIVLFIVYLFCSIGGSWHIYHIFDLVISGELVSTQYYELAKGIQMPEMMFCFQIDESLIDKNHKLTGNYLDELTREMSVNGTFKNIAYLNESNKWVPFDFHMVNRFFLLDTKCFKFKIDQTYDRNQFYFLSDSWVLKVNFGKSSYARKGLTYFMTKSKETAELSKIVILEYKEVAYKSSITHEMTLYKYEDRFSFIRKYFSSFQKDRDLSEQLLDLQSNEHNLRSLNLPMEEEDFEFEVGEELFEQLYSVQNQENRNKRTNLNYQKVSVDNQLRESYFGSDFQLYLVFLQKVVFSTNEENFGKLILSLLNVLSIWFDLGVLDLHPVFSLIHDYLLVYLYLHLPLFLFGKINQFLQFSCKWLKKLESPLCELLKPRKMNSKRTHRF